MAETTDTSAASNADTRASETADYVRSKLPEALQKPKVAIVCGSGLGGLVDTIDADSKVELAYSTIPNFPQSTGETTLALVL
jgi:purine-nucleoside phosphorylase